MRRVFNILIVVIIFASPLAFSNYARAEDLEGKLICGIGISGNYPYIESKIRRFLTIRPSDRFNDKNAADQLRRIKEFYKREGWFDTVVDIAPEYERDIDCVYIHFKIKKGFLLRYRNINVTGSYSLPESLVATKLNTWKNYTPRRLQEAIRRIGHTYRMHGYPLARVRLAGKVLDVDRHRIDVTVDIQEGPRVGVKFAGNKHLGGEILKRIITIYNEGAIDTYELEESAKMIQQRYIQRGFPDSIVKFSREEIGPQEILITFLIDEGRPERIRKIEFSGNERHSAGSIKDRMLSKSLSLMHPGIYDNKTLRGDLERIDDFYRSTGFPDVKTSAPHIEKLYGGTQLVIDIPIEEGKQFIINSIEFSGDIHFSERRLLKVIKAGVGHPLDFTILEEERLNLEAFHADHAYPYAKATIDVVRHPIEDTADLKITIYSGPQVFFGEISMIGDFITSQKAIRKALNFREGDPYSYEKIIDSKIALRRLGAFATADIEPEGLNEKSTVIPVTVKLEELRPFKLDFDIGFSTDERLVGGINFTNLNSFGWAKQTSLILLGGQRLSRGEIRWFDPKFLGWDLEMNLSGWTQYENKAVFNYIQAGGGIGFYRRFHRTSFGAKANLNRNYFLRGSSTEADAHSLRNNTIVNTMLSMSFDTRNSFAYPTKGTYTYGYSNFFNELRGNEAHFVKLGILGGVYFTFGEIFTVANDVRFENIQTFAKNVSVPSNELYLLGGDDTIRGFGRDSLGPVNAAGRPTGGRLRLVSNNELRIGIVDNFKWVIFHDMGFLTNNYSAVNAGQLRHSVGFGLHYITPIGPIKADYGFIIARRPGEDVGRFHLTFGYMF